MPSRRSSFVALLIVSGSLLAAGCASPSSAVRAPRLTVLAAEPGGAPQATAAVPPAMDALLAPPPPPTAELDLAPFRGQVVWITFFATDC